MKAFKIFSTFVVLAVATTVTAGSMFITVRAAALRDEAGIPGDVVAATPAVDSGNLRASLLANVPLAPDEILNGRHHHIVLDSQGGFTGRMSSLATADGSRSAAGGYTVKVLQHGAVVAEAMSDSEGRFSCSGLEPGVGGIIAYSDVGLMMYGVRLVAADDSTAIAEIGTEIELDADSTVVAYNDVMLARQLISSQLSGGDQRFSGEVTTEDHEFKFGSGQPATSVRAHRVQLQDDGTLHGQVNILDGQTGRHREVLDMAVHILHDGNTVTTAKVENNGSFVVSGLNPGVHSIVGTGRDGVFAIGIDILGSTYEPAADSSAKDGEFIPASIVQSLDLCVAPVPPENLNRDNFLAVTDGMPPADGPLGAPPFAPAPGGGGAFGGMSGGGGGTFGGGGGGFGGGGGLGALLAGAAGGVAGYLIGDDDDDDSPASPGI